MGIPSTAGGDGTSGPGDRAQEPQGVTRTPGRGRCDRPELPLRVHLPPAEALSEPPEYRNLCGLQSPNPRPPPGQPLHMGKEGGAPGLEPKSLGALPGESRQALSPACARAAHTRRVPWAPPCGPEVLRAHTPSRPRAALWTSRGPVQARPGSYSYPKSDLILQVGARRCN